MKRVLLFCGLTFLLGLSLGLFLHTWFPSSRELAVPTSPGNNGLTSNTLMLPSATPSVTVPEDTGPETADPASLTILERGFAVLEALKERDYETLALYVHSSGVRFTPYSTVDPARDLVLTPAQIASAAADTQIYTWGSEDGSGDPIELTIPDYFARFVFNTDYTEATRIGINQVVQGGNAFENVADSYPDCVFLDFNFSSLDPKLEGLDWCSLKLVFLPEQDDLKLVGILHGEWTI